MILGYKNRIESGLAIQIGPKRCPDRPKTLKIAEIAEIDEAKRPFHKSQKVKSGPAAVIPLGEVD